MEADQSESVSLLITHGARCQFAGTETPLQYAITKSKIRALQALAVFTEEVEVTDNDKLLALRNGCFSAFMETNRFQVDDPIHNCTALYWATLQHSQQRGKQGSPKDVATLEEMRQLLRRGANPNHFGYMDDCASPLFIACKNADLSAARLLLEHGADVNLTFTQPDQTTQPISHALDFTDNKKRCSAFYEQRYKLTELLLESGADPNAPSIMVGRTLLGELLVRSSSSPHDRIRDCLRPFVELLLKTRGIDVNLPSGSQRRRPLHLAVSSRDPSLVDLLLKRGANPTLGDIDGLLPIQLVPGYRERESWAVAIRQILCSPTKRPIKKRKIE